MIDLDFAIDGITVEPYAAIPTLRFALRVSNATPALAIENVMLNCQIRIEPARRPYGAIEHERLADLFGAPERWGQTLQSFLWTHVNVDGRRALSTTAPWRCRSRAASISISRRPSILTG